MRLNEWVNKVHTTAKSKGWWEKPREILELCMLFVTEIAEASEEARKPNNPFIYQVSLDGATKLDWNAPGVQETWWHTQKPEGEAIELVDLLIRLGDFMGSQGWNLAESIAVRLESPILKKESDEITFADLVADAMERIDPESFDQRPLVNHFLLVDLITKASNSGKELQPFNYAQVFFTTIGYMVWRGMDVEAAIELKAAYNEKRPYRHGGKLA